jgi:hypothetical protein
MMVSESAAVTAPSVTDEETITPICCWCGAPLVLKDRVAWCSGTEACREKQRACSLRVENETGTKTLFVPSPRQTEIMMSQAPNLFAWGNRGGGKSVCLRMYCHMLACLIPGFRYAILRTSFPELFKNHLSYLEGEMIDLGGETKGFRYNKTEHVCYYPHGSMGLYAQCATDADVKKILGAEVALVVFDEAPTFQWEHMRLIAGSIRVPAGSGLIPMTRYLGNPIGESIDELWKYFIDKDVDLTDDPEYRPNDWEAIEIRIEDNPHLNAKQYWRQMSGLRKHWLKAWKDGVRVEEDALFEFLPSKDGRPYHVVTEVPRYSDGKPLYTIDSVGRYHFPDWVRIYRAYDHGFDPDPAICLWFAVYGRRILCFKEKLWYRTLSTDIAADIVKESAGLHVVTTFCDPSIDIDTGADVYTIRQKMENAGVPMDPAINNREVFADAIHTLLEEKVTPHVPRLQFVAGEVAYTTKWLPRMKCDAHNTAAMGRHKHDHGPVCIAYFGMSQIPETTDTKPVRPRRFLTPSRGRGSAAQRVLDRLRARR